MSREATHLSKLAATVVDGNPTFDQYEALIRVLNGRIESKGLLFGMHYLISVAGMHQRIETFEELQPWFIAKIVPLVRSRIESLESGNATHREPGELLSAAHPSISSMESPRTDSLNLSTGTETRSGRGLRWARNGVFLLIVIPYAFRFFFSANLIIGDTDRAAAFIVQVIFGTIFVGAVSYGIGYLTGQSTNSKEISSAPVPPSDPIVTSATSDLKECPYCAETIKAKAIKCRYCGSSLSASTN